MTAQANLTKAKANADRARQLRSSGALSDEKIVEYFADEQTATASLASEEAALDSQKIKLDQTTVTAVDDGLITSRSAELGAVVSSGTELFRPSASSGSNGRPKFRPATSHASRKDCASTSTGRTGVPFRAR